MSPTPTRQSTLIGSSSGSIFCPNWARKEWSNSLATIADDPGAIVVAVTNAVVQPEEIERLAARLDWLRQQPDPATAWTEALLLATTSQRTGERPGLGILRIAYEGSSSVDYDISEPGTLTVRASMNKVPANE